MPVTNEDEEKGNRQGVNISPHYRRTFGLPMMRVMSPEAAEKENRRKSLGEGNLSLADLSKRVAEREEAERRKSPEERRNEAQVEKMLSVGRDLCVKFSSKQQCSNFSWRQLQASLKEFSDVKLGILSTAFLGLPESSRKILSHKYAIGFFRFKPKNEPKFSSTELNQALKKLKLNIVCILAYKDDAKSKISKVSETAGLGDSSPHQKEGNLEKTGYNLPPVPPEEEVAQDVLTNVPDDAEDRTAKDIIAPDTQDTPVHPEYAERLTRRIPPARYPSEWSSKHSLDYQASTQKRAKENSSFPEEIIPMTANNDPNVPDNLVAFLETVGSADLTREEDVRGLLCQISLEALKRDLGFGMSIDQLVPFCLINHLDSSFTVSQARNFFLFFGKRELSVKNIAPYLKNTSIANVFAQKKAAIKKLRKFSHSEVGTKKIETISQILRNSALVQKLRALNIHETEDLLKLTSARLISLLPVNEGNNFLSVRSIATNMDKHRLHLADGPEATRHLFNYHPQTYKPLLKTPEPSVAPPPDSAAAELVSSVSAAADPASSEASVADPNPASFETAFQKYGATLDRFMKEGGRMDHFSLRSNLDVGNGTRFRIVVEQLNLPRAE